MVHLQAVLILKKIHILLFISIFPFSCQELHGCKFVGKFINGAVVVVDGGHWLSRTRFIPKEIVRQLSRAVEKRSREAPVGVPRSKL